MTRKTTITLGLAGVVVTGALAASAWQSLTAQPSPTTVSTQEQVTVMSDARTPPYADDDHSDEADIWRLKQAELQRTDSGEDPAQDFTGPYEPISTSGDDLNVTLDDDR